MNINHFGKNNPKGVFKVQILKNCKTCGEPLDSKKRQRTFCSKKCRTRDYTIRYREYRSKLQLARYDREASIPSKNKIQCQICGKYYIQICSHVYVRHGLTGREYRKFLGLDVKKGYIPEWYRQKKRELNLETADIAWRNLKKGKKFWFKTGDKKAGRYERSPETMDRLHMGTKALSLIKNKK